jgi:hypothetical protein
MQMSAAEDTSLREFVTEVSRYSSATKLNNSVELRNSENGRFCCHTKNRRPVKAIGHDYFSVPRRRQTGAAWLTKLLCRNDYPSVFLNEVQKVVNVSPTTTKATIPRCDDCVKSTNAAVGFN